MSTTANGVAITTMQTKIDDAMASAVFTGGFLRIKGVRLTLQNDELDTKRGSEPSFLSTFHFNVARHAK